MSFRSIVILTFCYLSIIIAGPAHGSDLIVKRPVRVLDGQIPTIVSSEKVLKSKIHLLQSPGTILDSTYYDWQCNGGFDDHIDIYDNESPNIITGWTIAYQEDLVDRKMRFYFWDSAVWFGGYTMFYGAQSSIGSISFRSYGCLVACGDTEFDGQGYRAHLAVESFCGIGVYPNFITSPDTVGNQPRMAVNLDETFIITGISTETFNGIASGVMWDKKDRTTVFDGWQHFSDIAPDWIHDDMEPPTIHSGTNGKVGVVIPDYTGSVRLFESTDYGEMFDVLTISEADTANLPVGIDSTAARLGWINSDITYIDDESHVVWSAGQGANIGGDYGLLDFKSTIFHWSPPTGIDTVVVALTQSADPSRDDYVPTPFNHLSVDWPSIGLAVDGRTLVVAYTAFNPDDIDSTALPPTGYVDIWMTSSSDNGETWTEPQNVTNPDGSILGWDDRYPSIAKVNLDNEADPGKDAYMIYQSDDLAGTLVQGTEGSLNMDYIKFMGVDLSAVGIGDRGEGGSVAVIPKVFSLSQNYPNPFNPSTTIRYEIPVGNGTLAVKISVYDIRGRLVRKLINQEKEPGQYQVHWDGRDGQGKPASSGFYLYRIEAGDFISTRKLVVVR